MLTSGGAICGGLVTEGAFQAEGAGRVQAHSPSRESPTTHDEELLATTKRVPQRNEIEKKYTEFGELV